MTTNVYQYSDPFEFIADFINEQKNQDSLFSMRKWAKQMGLKSHNLLVMILTKKRSLKIKHMTFLGDGLALSSSEKIYFQTLIQYHNAEDAKEKQLYEHFLAELNPADDFQVKEIEEFKTIADWYHTAILTMSSIKGICITANQISSHLKYKVDTQEIEKALKRLEALGLLKRNRSGNLEATHDRLTTKDDISNEAVRVHHKQVANLAIKAVDLDDPQIREFQSFSMAINENKVAFAKEMIREFRSKLSKAVSGGSDCIYQTNIQFFQLTESPAINLAGDEGVDLEQTQTTRSLQ